MQNPNGAVQGNSQNTPTANVPRMRSTFPLGYHFFDTHRFGEYHPHFVAEGVKEDILPIRSSHNVLSYTLKSPLMQNVSMKKDYFSVPMEAILPLNWEKFFDNPIRGDDVLNDVGPSVANFWSLAGNFFTGLRSALVTLLGDTSQQNYTILQATLRFLVLTEYFYSNGSLLSSLGCHGSPYLGVVTGGEQSSYDKFFDSMIAAILAPLGQNGSLFDLSVDGYSYTVSMHPDSSKGVIGFRHALALMRDNPLFSISRIYPSVPISSAILTELNKWTFTPILSTAPLNLSRLWAYQLVCAHYYSNDHIDFVFSAELYRQLIGNYILKFFPTNQGVQVFTYNGVTYRYDYLSAHMFYQLVASISGGSYSSMLTTTSANAAVSQVSAYLCALLGYRRSLRYLDYFTGSRAQPLAVGSTGVSVVNNTVDVVDVTRNIQRQRFLNAVNRVRHNFEGYLQGIFGGSLPAPDYHNPFFLAHTDDTVYGSETENTGAAQMSDQIAITSNFRSNGSRYMFEIRCDRPCVLLGITYYDIPRVYTKTTERHFFHLDRFDMFNPFMQFIGDQPVYIQETGIGAGTNILAGPLANFAYSLRHMEYKQRYNQAAGGFVENLTGFAFLALDNRGNQYTINPDWIRSVSSEFDDFYVSLTGYSLGSYFHFIVDNFNDCSGSRPMAYAPSIL